MPSAATVSRVLFASFSVTPGPDRHGVQDMYAFAALASRYQLDGITVRFGHLPYVQRMHRARMLRVPLPEAPLPEQLKAFQRALRRQLEGTAYDVVHVRDGWCAETVRELRPMLGYRMVFDVSRSTLPQGRREALAPAEISCVRVADQVIVPTETGRRYLIGHGLADRVATIAPSVDINRFDVEFDPARTPPAVMYAGPISHGRGLRTLLLAMRRVIAEMPAQLVMLGAIQDGFAEPLRVNIAQMGLEKHVQLLGAIDNDDMPRVLSTATICVAPSSEDPTVHPLAPFPTKLLEYMACQRAVIAPRSSAVAELVEDRVNGFLFKPGDPDDLARQILTLLRGHGIRDAVRVAARRTVRELYPASRARRRLLSIYDELIPAHRQWPLRRVVRAFAVTGDGSSQAGNPPLPSEPEDTLATGVPPHMDTSSAQEPWVATPPASADGVTGEAAPTRAGTDDGEPEFVAAGTLLPEKPTQPF